MADPGVENCTVPVTTLAVLVKAMTPAVVETFRLVARSAPVWLMAPPAVSVKVPPTVAPPSTTALESTTVASLAFEVETVSVAKLLPALVKMMLPPGGRPCCPVSSGAEATTAATSRPPATIAPDWLIEPWARSVSRPPTLARAMVRPVESLKLAPSVPCVRTLSAPKALAALLSAMAPVTVEALRLAAWMAPV